MKIKVNHILFGAVFIGWSIGIWNVNNFIDSKHSTIQKSEAEVVKLNEQLTETTKQLNKIKYGIESAKQDPEQEKVFLGNQILKVMKIVNSPLSKVEKQVMAQLLSNTASSVFETYEQKINWIILIGIESKFNNDSQSSVGAIGIGQLIPKYASDFGKSCNLEGATAKDLKNPIINASLSACYFRDLIETFDGSVPLALSAYNAGAYSPAVADLQKLKTINKETGSYISKFYYIKEAVNKGEKNEKVSKENTDSDDSDE